jgi:hypothetical protein
VRDEDVIGVTVGVWARLVADSKDEKDIVNNAISNEKILR